MSNYSDPPGLAEWEKTVPEPFRRDPIWRTPAYRFGLWLSDLAKGDARLLRQDRDRRNDTDQLLRAVNGISSNISEGYSRSTGPERARYYDYALATTRESRDWYFKCRDLLGDALVVERIGVLDRIIRILTVVVPRERDDSRRKRRRKRKGDAEETGDA